MTFALLSVAVIAFGPLAILGGLAIASLAIGMCMNFAASTKARFDIPSGDVSRLNFPMAAGEEVFQGTFVATNAAGFTKLVADEAGLVLSGIAELDVDNTGGLDGAKDVPVIPITEIKYTDLNANTPLDTWINELVFFVDDNTVDLVGVTVNDVLAGKVKEILKTGANGKVRVSLLERVAG